MSINTVRVVTKNRPSETLVIKFTNIKAATEFYFAAGRRNDVVEVNMDQNTMTTYGNAKAAMEALLFWL
jgi:hypothetical protein